MNWLAVFGSVASILGLIVSAYTLYKVTTLPAVLKRHSRDRHLTSLIDKIMRLPATKSTLPESTTRELEFILTTIRTYYVSILPFRQRTLKTLLDTLEVELRGQRRREIIQNNLQLIRDEVTIR